MEISFLQAGLWEYLMWMKSGRSLAVFCCVLWLDVITEAQWNTPSAGSAYGFNQKMMWLVTMLSTLHLAKRLFTLWSLTHAVHVQAHPHAVKTDSKKWGHMQTQPARLTDFIFSGSSFMKVNISWFLSSSMTLNWLSLGCGQNKTFEDVILGFWKHWSTFFTIFLLHFIDKPTNLLIYKIIDRFLDYENKRYLQP